MQGSFAQLDRSASCESQAHQQQLQELERRIRSLQEQNAIKVRRIIVMSLHTSSLCLQLKRYRDSDSRELARLAKENEELACHLHLLKKQLEDRDEDAGPPQPDPQTEADRFEDCFYSTDGRSTHPGSSLVAEDPPHNLTLAMDIFSEPRNSSISDNLHIIRSLRSTFGKALTPRTEGPDGGLSSRLDAHDGGPEDRSQLARQLVRTFMLQHSFEEDTLTREQILEEMVVHYDSCAKARDRVIRGYKAKLEEVKDKLAACEAFKAKQKALLRKKEEENAYLIEAVKATKEEHMRLVEKHNGLLLSAKSKPGHEAERPKPTNAAESLLQAFNDIF